MVWYPLSEVEKEYINRDNYYDDYYKNRIIEVHIDDGYGPKRMPRDIEIPKKDKKEDQLET